MPVSNLRILGLIPDLFFSSRVGSTAQSLGFSVDWIESAERFPDPEAFLAHMRPAPPALVILDLNAALPWQAWLAAAKADTELAAIPWLAFGSHKDTEAFAAAKQAGADRIVARSKFSAELPDLIRSLELHP